MDKATGKFSVESITEVRMFSYYLLDFHELFKLEKTLFYLIANSNSHWVCIRNFILATEIQKNIF